MGTTRNTPPTELVTKDGYFPIVSAQKFDFSDRYMVTVRIPGLDGLYRTSCDAQGRKDAYIPFKRVAA